MASSVPKTPQEAHEIERCKRLQQSFQQFFESNPLFSPHATIAFETLEKLGEGGMGSVFRVKDLRMNRQAALKVLLSENPELRNRERFMREAHITARLNHPTIPAVYEAGSTKDNQVFMLMKVIEGETLEDRIHHYHNNDCPPALLRELLGVLCKVAEAVAYAHSQRVLHRDLKPANIMVGRFGEVLVMDWGLAKEMDSAEIDVVSSDGMPDALQFEDNGLTLSGSIIGTPGFMSPEQASGEAIDELTDVFSLGIILTHILTGLTPIPGSQVMEKIVATVKGWISSPRDLKAEVPGELNSLAILATQAEREKRLPSAEQFQKELMAYLAGENLESHDYRPWDLLKRRVSRNPRSLIGMLFGTLIFSVLALSLGEYFVVQAASDLAIVNQQEADAIVQSKKDLQAARLDVANEERHLAQREAAIAAKMLTLFDQAKELSRRGGKESELTELVDKALELGGRDYVVLMTAAEIYERAGMKDKLPDLLNEAVGKNSKPYGALFLLHVLENEESGDFKITNSLKKIIEISKSNNEVNEFTLFDDASKEFYSGDYKKAVEILDKIDQSVDNFYLLHNLKFGIYSRVKNYKNALTAVKQSLSIRPNSLQSKNNLALTLFNLGKSKSAEKVYLEILSIDPNNFSANYNLGDMYLRLEKFKLAEKYFRAAKIIDPKSSYSFLGMGNLNKLKGNYKTALRYYEQVLEINPQATLASFGIATCFQAMGRYDLAISKYSTLIGYFRSKSVDLTEEWASLWKERGICRYRVGQYRKAVDDLSFVMKYFPRDFESYAYRALTFLELKQWQSVIEDSNKAYSLNSSDLTVLGYRAEAHFRLKKYREALNDYEFIGRNAKEDSHKRRAQANAAAIRKNFPKELGKNKE